MTQHEDAVGGDEPIIDAEPTLEERFEAIGDDEPEAEEGLEDEPEEIDEEIVEEEAQEAVKAPVSWTEEEKAEFANLPPEIQATVARRESEREKFIQAKSRESREVATQAERAANERLAQAQELQKQQLQALLPQIPQKPSAHLQYQDPQAYAYHMDAYEGAVAQHNYIVQQLDSIAGEQQTAAQRAQAQREAEALDTLREALPEYFDDATGAELRDTMRSTAKALGYTDDAIAAVDAGDVLALNQAAQWKAKAEKYDSLMSKQMEKVRGAKSLPKVSRPGTARGKGAVSNERYTADRNAMKQGDEDATLRVFERFV